MKIGLWALAAAGVCMAPGCGGDDSTAAGQTGVTAGTSGTSGASGNGGASASSNAGGVSGQTQVGVDASLITGQTQCSNGRDDDGDGQVDGFDSECTGPLDNDESTFATGIPGDNRDPKWQDCFFDGNSGAGDDGCRYGTGCLTGDIPQDDPDCTVTQQCVNFCGGYTPNGCDCFGCCTIHSPSGGTADVKIGTACSVDKINDATACPPCTKSTLCANNCGACELCLGKTIEDLPITCTPTSPPDAGPPPPDAAPPPPTYTCDNPDAVKCSPTEPCPGGAYCAQGCCLTIH
jgi:hypothetical protein